MVVLLPIIASSQTPSSVRALSAKRLITSYLGDSPLDEILSAQRVWFLYPDQTLPNTHTLECSTEKHLLTSNNTYWVLTTSGFVLSALQALSHFIIKVIL